MADSFAYDVFLSHNSNDKPRVRRLAERLKDAGLRVCFDEWVIQPGDDIYLVIERGLQDSVVRENKCIILIYRQLFVQYIN
jgi:hypothetical protein